MSGTKHLRAPRLKTRCGIFNKYCAVNAPPAAGYYPYNPAALEALSDDGKRLIPVCFDKPITTTRLLIEDTSSQESKFLMHRDGEWKLPGGEGWEEERLVGWDVGARIGIATGAHPNTTRFRGVVDVLH